jgi:long-chain fatty acid transport protein
VTTGAVPWPANADGFRNPFQGAAAIAQGNAFAAQADDPTAIFYNPAGLAWLPGIHVSVGLQLVNVDTEFTSPSGERTKNDLGGLFGFPPPGQVFVTANVRDLGLPALSRLTVGFGIQNLFGFGTRYPDDGPFATAVTEASLPLLDLKPTLAYRLTDRLAVGLGVDIFTFVPFLGEGQFEQKLVWPGGLGIPPGARVEINGTGTTAGLNASLLVTPVATAEGEPRLNVGFVWRSQAVLPLDGELLVNGAKVAEASSKFRFPESYTLAFAGWPIRDAERAWKVEVDLDYVRWSSIRDFDVRFSNGVVLRNPQHWDDAISVGIGTEYRWRRLARLPGWDVALRAGYLRSMTPIPDENFNPAVPDSDVNIWSVGLGLLCRYPARFLGWLACGRAMGLDVAYQALVFESRTVNGHPNPAVNGTYRTTTHDVALTFRLAF